MRMLRKMCASAGARFRGKLFTHIYIIFLFLFTLSSSQDPCLGAAVSLYSRSPMAVKSPRVACEYMRQACRQVEWDNCYWIDTIVKSQYQQPHCDQDCH